MSYMPLSEDLEQAREWANAIDDAKQQPQGTITQTRLPYDGQQLTLNHLFFMDELGTQRVFDFLRHEYNALPKKADA